MSHLRGSLPDGSPAFGVVTSKARKGMCALDYASELGRCFLKPATPAPTEVIGATAAARVDGRIDMEEGMSHDGIERIALIVAETDTELFGLSIRTRPVDAVESEVDRILSSFVLTAV